MSELSLFPVSAWPILDSRGFPTLQVKLHSIGGLVFDRSVPEGGSTGVPEAKNLCDDGPAWPGQGVQRHWLG
ncbi:hypothetical protein [Paeniglutamicibacter cryotolerans]|uniref:Enolase n=1 Tax=Paeniglutamicibacter cryotolerans TaxID=670079 RepID=A0A839QSU0_9MICC|nr:hypothetical protein [Paeniglutamicibacter cryotolerans]MBB2996332.1 enolase [Paeniglutamicibacter cryotolerans]